MNMPRHGSWTLFDRINTRPSLHRIVAPIILANSASTTMLMVYMCLFMFCRCGVPFQARSSWKFSVKSAVCRVGVSYWVLMWLCFWVCVWKDYGGFKKNYEKEAGLIIPVEIFLYFYREEREISSVNKIYVQYWKLNMFVDCKQL